MLFKNIRTVKCLNRTLFVVGNVNLLNSPCMSVAGSRQIDSSSAKWLSGIVSGFGAHTLVSGLALGADAVAHKTALAHNIPQIAVLPSGINNIVPKQHVQLASDIVASGGLLVSEYPANSGPTRGSYVARNKIIAELGKCLIVPQFNTHSGTRHTVNFASSLKKPIIVQNANYSGNQFIINNGSFNTIIK